MWAALFPHGGTGGVDASEGRPQPQAPCSVPRWFLLDMWGLEAGLLGLLRVKQSCLGRVNSSELGKYLEHLVVYTMAWVGTTTDVGCGWDASGPSCLETGRRGHVSSKKEKLGCYGLQGLGCEEEKKPLLVTSILFHPPQGLRAWLAQLIHAFVQMTHIVIASFQTPTE